MIPRFFEAPGLFGVGVGQGTSSPITCDWCTQEYNGHIAPDGDDDGGETVTFASFGGKTICDCCFATVEGAVLAAMRDILPWYGRILAQQRARLDAATASYSTIVRQASCVEFPDGTQVCCERHGEYNGYGSGARLFTCPTHCPCHD